jgi:hypothetical protein
LQKIERSSTTKLDRWNITITENPEAALSSSSLTDGEKENNNQLNGSGSGSDKIPFNIINNYFSIGVVSYDVTKNVFLSLKPIFAKILHYLSLSQSLFSLVSFSFFPGSSALK